MATTPLSALLNPKSIAVIGASNQTHRTGFVIINNLLQSHFNGPIFPVTPKYDSVAGILAYPTISDLPRTPDIAIVCTHASKTVKIIKELGEKGVKSAVILAAGTSTLKDETGTTVADYLQQLAKRYQIRLLGPNSMGIILPWLNLNASFAPTPANKGNIAFISQSAAVCTTILDWARNKNIGFSTFISLGDGLDINFAELLDALSRDGKTEAILLYLDSVNNAREFLSAARAAARNRRILVVKGGRTLAGSEAVKHHTGSNLGADIVYEAAIRRAGLLRVKNTHELFAAVETLAHSVPLRGERLAIITNGGGPAIMAVDSLSERGGKLAQFSSTTLHQLKKQLPNYWPASNPIDLLGDATIERYEHTINTLLDSDEADALLIMHTPSAIAPSQQTAERLVQTLKQHPNIKKFNVLSNWTGEYEGQVARDIFAQAGFPAYRTPESAVSAFMYLVEYRRNQKLLRETPKTLEPISTSNKNFSPQQAQAIIQELLNHNITQLETHEVQPILKGYGFKTLPTWLANDAVEAIHIAEQIGYPVAVKLRSPDIEHKSEVHGVMLHLRDAQEVESAAQAMLERVNIDYPTAQIDGLLVQRMANRAGAQELRVAVRNDPIFGPVIFLGEELMNWNCYQDSAVGLPPLNMALARYMIIDALKSHKIKQRSTLVPIDIDALCSLLVTVSQLIIDCPNIESLDIHPLLANGPELTIIDASMTLNADTNQIPRLAIRPYPKELEQWVELKSGKTILLRPILPEDEPEHKSFISHVTQEDLYKRFFSDVGEFNHEAMSNFTQIDYDREMAFIAVFENKGHTEILGVVRALSDPDNMDAEFAILIRSDLKGLGLGRIMMEKIIHYCQHKGLQRITGMTMPNNRSMIMLAQKMGFHVDIQMEDGVVEMELNLIK
ncbi:bifunctional acetate--CoA ligase family protein/GNAT family N-acetyltransferase [Photobacterium damselae]|uniref:bifunctional acetate--CoA ligase family protein/GNAT family N-acetyltransferase n=1 Tax=Photobacterium damselae TaxID=38293 RepID=UPI000D966AFF|nr:bifunctional acetate--CoA ligase family protein/GNAT family N-acetyltransferase [Photobacterium damselae]NVO73107.1 bifunctional acetate--CoA ligase family protein/GNAT family N-acetyltransferase [Photobacterium damselae subsp. damselae]SPY30150.1 succinyl-CoA synthetase subunit alpha [Photobacterium damselae]